MKIPISGIFAISVFAMTATSASAQTLGTAANYSIFVQNDGTLELKDANQLFGNVGVSNGAELDGKGESNTWNGTIFKHTGGTIKDAAGLNPSGGTQSSLAIDAALNQANIDLNNYASYLGGLSATATYGKQTSSFSFNTNMGLTVLDFEEIDLDKENFTLNGQAGGMDTIIIRTSKFLEFKDSDLVLNNIKTQNVIWYHTGSSNFDLHKTDLAGDPSEFQKFAGTIIAPNAQVRLGEVDFTGKVFGSDLKMGSGFVFQVPEPSSSLMIVLGASGLLLRRRAKR